VFAAACGADGDAGSDGLDGTLRVLGLRTDLADPVKAAAQRDLPFRINFDVTTAAGLIERAVERPGSFDVLSGYCADVERLVAARAVAGLSGSRIHRWPEMDPVYTRGTVSGESERCSTAEGRMPSSVLYAASVGPEASLAAPETAGTASQPPALTGAPSTFSVESFGYDRNTLALEPDRASWGELLNESFRGRVAVVDDPVDGLQETGLAARALGLVHIRTLGNPTRQEVDGLVSALSDLRRKGHFRAFWSSFDESVELMAAGDVVVGSLSPPATVLLQTAGYHVRSAAPPEGYRGWAGLLFGSSSAASSPARLQAVHDYVDWWHSGVPGAILMRHGYYNAAMTASRAVVSREEWDYWIEGRPAAAPLASAFGPGSIAEGRVRDGGSMLRRACRVAVWRSRFDEQEHAESRWRELVTG
jgi:putative spermidine/putrescine transport system substrate-binding protein